MNQKTKKKIDMQSYILYIGVVLIIVVFSVLSGIKGIIFLTPTNISNIIVQASIIAVVAIGSSLVVLTGGIDLSVGSIVGLSGIIVGLCVNTGMPVFLAAIIGILVGGLVGLINGIGISLGKIPAFIMTLGTMEIARGLALYMSDGKSIAGFPMELNDFANSGILFGIPNYIVFVIILYVVMSIVMYKTKFGRHVYAIGGNMQAARLSGINVRVTEIVVYALSGLLSGFAAFMLISRMVYASPTAGQGYEMDAIASTVLGGIALSGGKGKIYNTLVGALILNILTAGLQILNVSTYIQNIAVGIVIIVAVFFDKAKERKAE